MVGFLQRGQKQTTMHDGSPFRPRARIVRIGMGQIIWHVIVQNQPDADDGKKAEDHQGIDLRFVGRGIMGEFFAFVDGYRLMG